MCEHIIFNYILLCFYVEMTPQVTLTFGFTLLWGDGQKSDRRETGWERKGEREVPEFQDFWHWR